MLRDENRSGIMLRVRRFISLLSRKLPLIPVHMCLQFVADGSVARLTGDFRVRARCARHCHTWLGALALLPRAFRAPSQPSRYSRTPIFLSSTHLSASSTFVLVPAVACDPFPHLSIAHSGYGFVRAYSVLYRSSSFAEVVTFRSVPFIGGLGVVGSSLFRRSAPQSMVSSWSRLSIGFPPFVSSIKIWTSS